MICPECGHPMTDHCDYPLCFCGCSRILEAEEECACQQSWPGLASTLRKWLRETGDHRLTCSYHLAPETGCNCGFYELTKEEV